MIYLQKGKKKRSNVYFSNSKKKEKKEEKNLHFTKMFLYQKMCILFSIDTSS